MNEPWYNEDEEKDTQESARHPRPEMLLMRQAFKYLTPKQRTIWEYHNFDRLTQDEIAEKTGITQQAVSRHIEAIEKKIAKWVRFNMGTYELLKRDYTKKVLK